MLHKKVKVLLMFVLFLAMGMLCVQLRFSMKKSQLVSSRSGSEKMDHQNLNVLQNPSKHLSQLLPDVHRDIRIKKEQLRSIGNDDDDIDLGSFHIRKRDLRYYIIDDDLVQEMSLSWILFDLGLEVRLNCRKGSKVDISKEDALLVICLNSTHLTKVAMTRRLTKFEAKLLVLTSIFNQLGGNGTDIMHKGQRAGELSIKFDELVISKLATLIAKRLKNSGGPKLGYHKIEAVKLNSSSYIDIHESPWIHSPDFVKDLDLSFLYNAEEGNDTSSLTVMQPSPAQMSEKDLQLIENNNLTLKSGRKSGIHLSELQKQDKNESERVNGHQTGVAQQNIPPFVSPTLMKLQGYRYLKHRTLSERGFLAKYTFKSSKLVHMEKYIRTEMERVADDQREMMTYSLDPNLIKRADFQHKQVKKFCSNEPSSQYLPRDISQLDSLFKHLLFDDKQRVIFCCVPKSGCSNMKRTFLMLNGYLSANASQVYERLPESILSRVKSFQVLGREGALYRLNNYYKYAILQNPLERLLSVYQDELEKPLNYKLVKQFPDQLKAYILTLTNRPLIERWSKEKNFSQDIHPSFTDTLQFMTKYDLSSYNEYFLSFLKLCQPCAMNYDVILNMKTFPYDIIALLEYLGIPADSYPLSAKSECTRASMSSSFKHVPSSVKNEVFKRLGKELRFYYELHPEEMKMHNHL